MRTFNRMKGIEKLREKLPDYQVKKIYRFNLIALIAFLCSLGFQLILDSLPRIFPGIRILQILAPFTPVFGSLVIVIVGFLIVYNFWRVREKKLKKSQEKAYQASFIFVATGIPMVISVIVHSIFPSDFIIPNQNTESLSWFLAHPLTDSFNEFSLIFFYLRLLFFIFFLVLGLIMAVKSLKTFGIDYMALVYVYYPEESLTLSRVDGHAQASPDRAKFKKISKGGGFVSPSFIFKPTHDCIKGIVHAVVNFINYEDQIETINVEPHEIRMICGLLKAKTVSNEDFETLTNDLLKFNKVGEDFIIPYRADLLFQKLMGLLKSKNFAVVNSEKEESEGKFHGIIKGFAEGSFSKNSVGLKLTLNGNINEHKSALKVNVYAEDKDMTPHIISEFETAVSPKNCPECEEDLPTELVKKLMEGVPSYCEACGANLLESGDMDM